MTAGLLLSAAPAHAAEDPDTAVQRMFEIAAAESGLPATLLMAEGPNNHVVVSGAEQYVRTSCNRRWVHVERRDINPVA